MPEFIWRALARFLARPAIAEWLINRAARTPYDHLVVRDGRVCRVPHDYPISMVGKWYLKRYWLFRLGPIQARIHNIMDCDPGREQHNHPWAWRTFMLRGFYKEERGNNVEWRERGDTACMGRQDFHRISEVSPYGVWTLFLTIGRPNGWGFLLDDKIIPHGEYGENN